MNIAQFLFKRSSLEVEYARGELPASESKEDTQLATRSREQNAKRRQVNRRNTTHKEDTRSRKKAAAYEEGIHIFSCSFILISMFEH